MKFKRTYSSLPMLQRYKGCNRPLPPQQTVRMPLIFVPIMFKKTEPPLFLSNFAPDRMRAMTDLYKLILMYNCFMI
jgi:hypothetical protein